MHDAGIVLRGVEAQLIEQGAQFRFREPAPQIITLDAPGNTLRVVERIR